LDPTIAELQGRSMSQLSIHFYAGPSRETYERFEQGRPQVYASHDELMRLARSLLDGGIAVRLVSLTGAVASRSEPTDGLEFVELGATAHHARRALRDFMQADDADHIIGHFPSVDLMRAMIGSDARLMMVLADSFNDRSIRARLRTARVMRLLRHRRIEWVANHCEPSTRQLAALGVPETKLLAWDVPHVSSPNETPPRQLRTTATHTLFYAGTIGVDKGISDLIEAVATLAERGITVRAVLAGDGDVTAMRELATRRRVADRIEFLGTVPNEQVIEGMRAADLVAIPSRHVYPEGMPFTIFEALVSRTPIVCSDHPMFVSHLVDGLSASTFAAGDPHSFADAVERTLSDPDRYRALSERAGATFKALDRITVDYSTMIREWARPTDPGWLERHSLARIDR
jgi:glycosyltransferase involved in cell wall biosynthesis